MSFLFYPEIQIEYNITDASQLTFLRLLTTNVSQTITYNCKNSIALGDAKRSLKLLTSSDVELTNEEGKNQYDVISDECTVSFYVYLIQ